MSKSAGSAISYVLLALLDETWLIIASDHGESFGEHAGVYCHGTSLYQTEVHVPLLIVPPSGAPTKRVITEAVSLRDVATTIADVAGQAAGSPFPGRSLARFWNEPIATTPPGPHRRIPHSPRWSLTRMN